MKNCENPICITGILALECAFAQTTLILNYLRPTLPPAEKITLTYDLQEEPM